jgi:hypothetical protein
MNKVLIGILIVIVILLIFNLWNFSNIKSDLFEGLWNASDEFCKKSEIDGMMIYIGPLINFYSNKRKAYLIMHSENNVVVNKKFEISFSSGLSSIITSLFVTNTFYKNVYLYDTELESNSDVNDSSSIPLTEIMPLEQSVKIIVSDAHMIWTGIGKKDTEETFADLYKSHST